MENSADYSQYLRDLNTRPGSRENLSNIPNAVIITGPTGVGKSTIFRKVYAEHPDLGQLFAYSDRQLRGSGDTKRCLDVNQFTKMLDSGQFALTFTLYGHRYGDTYEDIESVFSRYNRLLLSYPLQKIGDLVNLCHKYNKTTSTVCLLPPSLDELYMRLNERPERIPYALDEIQLLKKPEISQHIDCFIINDDIKKVLSTIEYILKGSV
jgi:guanylate kinase